MTTTAMGYAHDMIPPSDYEQNTIYRGDVNGANQVALVTGVEDVFDVKIHSGHRFFFSSPKLNAIYVAAIDGSGAELFIRGVSSTRGIAVHEETERIFWADHSDVYSGNLTTGQNREHIASGFGSLLFIHLDQYGNKLYVADYQDNAIYSMELDGSDIQVVMNVTSPRSVVMYTNITHRFDEE